MLIKIVYTYLLTYKYLFSVISVPIRKGLLSP